MSNYEALGYMIVSALNLGIDKSIIEKLEQEMKNMFDWYSEAYAEKVYKDFV